MPKPVIFGTSAPSIPELPKAPESKIEGGWDKAIGQVASSVKPLTRKSKKPWPKDASSGGDAGKA